MGLVSHSRRGPTERVTAPPEFLSVIMGNCFYGSQRLAPPPTSPSFSGTLQALWLMGVLASPGYCPLREDRTFGFQFPLRDMPMPFLSPPGPLCFFPYLYYTPTSGRSFLYFGQGHECLCQGHRSRTMREPWMQG